jgi:hypothetical protein
LRPSNQGCLHAEPIAAVDIWRGNPTRLGECSFARLVSELTGCQMNYGMSAIGPKRT